MSDWRNPGNCVRGNSERRTNELSPKENRPLQPKLSSGSHESLSVRIEKLYFSWPVWHLFIKSVACVPYTQYGWQKVRPCV